MEAIVFSNWFEAPDELEKFCIDLGYTKPVVYAGNKQLMFDKRVIAFCKERTQKMRGVDVYKGKLSAEFKIGFAGLARFADIDTRKAYVIRHGTWDEPMIKYLRPVVVKQGVRTEGFDIDDEVYCIYRDSVNNDFYCDNTKMFHYNEKAMTIQDYRVYANGTVEYLINNKWFISDCVFGTYEEAEENIIVCNTEA